MKNKPIISLKDASYLEERFKSVFLTKDEFEEKFVGFKSDIIDKLDEVLGEVKAGREEQTVISHKVSELGDRVEALEDIHPQGQHAVI